MRSYCILLTMTMLAAMGCTNGADRDTVFQTSTIHALMEGAYDGDVTIGELKQRGNLGIGTFNALDGEMVMLNGNVYQVLSDGTVNDCSNDMRTPFAAVTFFEADKSVMVIGRIDFKYLTGYIDSLLPTTNVPYAVRISGWFSYVKTRSVPRQSRPYQRLVEVTKNQPTFEFKDIAGTIVGFRMPAYVKGINVPGWHLHFLTEDKLAGGHLLAFKAQQVNIEIDPCDAVFLSLPTTGDFAKADLTKQNAAELEKIEK